MAEAEKGSDKVFAILSLDECEFDAPYMSPIRVGDEIVGEITSCAMAYRSGSLVALAMIKPEFAAAGQELTVGIFGKRIAAKSHGQTAIWDPKNERIRA